MLFSSIFLLKEINTAPRLGNKTKQPLAWSTQGILPARQTAVQKPAARREY